MCWPGNSTTTVGSLLSGASVGACGVFKLSRLRLWNQNLCSLTSTLPAFRPHMSVGTFELPATEHGRVAGFLGRAVSLVAMLDRSPWLSWTPSKNVNSLQGVVSACPSGGTLLLAYRDGNTKQKRPGFGPKPQPEGSGEAPVASGADCSDPAPEPREGTQQESSRTGSETQILA